MRIAHISSVHHASDPRINKQLRTLAEAGNDVYFVTGDLSARSHANYTVVPVPPGNSRRSIRMTVTAPKCAFKAFKLAADVYHLHDPELLPFVPLLKMRGRVIYDIHEDYVSSVQQKTYIAVPIRNILAPIIGRIEALLSRHTTKIIAERYYLERFPNATTVLNYPSRSLIDLAQDRSHSVRSSLIYTGSVTVDRGARNLASLANALPEFHVQLVGECSATLYEQLTASLAYGNLSVVGVGEYVSPKTITQHYEARRWLAGLAIFPPTKHYERKELTKFFEYMAAGLPVIASNFPTWKKLIEENGVGICVDPRDIAGAAAAVRWLAANPKEAERMGKQGRDLVTAQFNWDGEARKLVHLYERLRPRVRQLRARSHA